MEKIYAVGIGPGGREEMTQRAIECIINADVIAGYDRYVELLGDLCDGKEIFSSGMRGERARAKKVIEYAKDGRITAMVCSGDAGVYGMAGLLMEMAPEADIEVVPGITAAVSGAARLGAPLMNDFCVISLSDQLTPAEKIEKRLRCAAESDMVIVLYNPRSKQRPDNLMKACDIVMEYRPADTVCGWVRNIGREGEEARTLSLGELKGAPLDMLTTVFIGSSDTVILDGRMVTRRGYEI